MKKTTFILVSLLAIALTAGLVLTACSNGGGGGGSGEQKYSGMVFKISVSDFNTIFGKSVADNVSLDYIESSDPAGVLRPKAEQGFSKASSSERDSNTGLTLAQCKTYLQQKCSDENIVTDSTGIINKLEADKYVLAYIGKSGTGKIAVAAAIKE